MDITLLSAEKKTKDNQIKPRKHTELNKSCHHYMKKDHRQSNKIIQIHIISKQPFPDSYNDLDYNLFI